jgi:isopenicillin-N epimerase
MAVTACRPPWTISPGPFRHPDPVPGARQFGHGLRHLWPLEDGAIYLNHGTVGVTPLPVLDAQNDIRLTIERHPARFMLRDLKSQLRAAADLLAGRFGGAGSDYVFQENATTAINAVLRSIELKPGDEVLITDHTYGAVANAAAYACRKAGATLVKAALPFPVSDAGAIMDALRRHLGPHTRLAVLDHITSETALVLPLADMIAACHAAGAQVVVDGAHVPGQMPLDVPALGADWYAANLHKWHFVPRSCAFLWTQPDLQADLHPAVISWRLDEGYTAEFDWTGTRDPSAYLCLPAAAAFMDDLGADAVMAYNHDLACRAGQLFARRFNGPATPPELTGSMTLAPLPAGLAADHETANHLRARLLDEHGIEVPVIPREGRLWARLSAQVYCELSDFERLADAVASISGE